MLPYKWLHQLWQWRDMQEKMLQIAANMKKLKDAAIQVATSAVTVKGYAREDVANSC